jgi:hypothetical protein
MSGKCCDTYKLEIDRKIKAIKLSYKKYKMLKNDNSKHLYYTNKNVEERHNKSTKKSTSSTSSNEIEYIKPILLRNFRRNKTDERIDKMESQSNIESEFYSSIREHHFSRDEIEYIVVNMRGDLIYNQPRPGKLDSWVSIYTQIDDTFTIVSYDGMFYTSKPISLNNRINFSSREMNPQDVNTSCVFINLI